MVSRCLLIVSLLLFLACGIYIGFHVYQAKQMENLSSQVTVSSETQKTETKKVKVPVNFKKLKKINPDIYAWINIENANVDYPIVQSAETNSYYLNHTIEGDWSVYGSIYTEDYNQKDFSDFNTLIYGHNMKNGTMFGSLKKFRDPSFFEKNRYINVYLENRILKYEIFAACTWDNKHILANNDFVLREDRMAYLEKIYDVRDMNSQINKDIEVTADDKIISLSTCMNDKSKRFIVSGVLVYDSQNP